MAGIRKCGYLNHSLYHCRAIFQSFYFLRLWQKTLYMEQVMILGNYAKMLFSFFWWGLPLETSTAATSGTVQLSAEHCLCSLKHHFQKMQPVWTEMFNWREIISNLFLCIWSECQFGQSHALVWQKRNENWIVMFPLGLKPRSSKYGCLNLKHLSFMLQSLARWQ